MHLPFHSPYQHRSIQVDFRVNPKQKPVPPDFPTKDPLSFLIPLFDSYSGPSRPESTTNPILNPILADLSDLPLQICLIVPTIDILLDEQLKFAERLKREIDAESEGGGGTAPRRSVQFERFEKCLHGWYECE